MNAICDACDSEPCLCDQGDEFDFPFGSYWDADDDECSHDTEQMEGEVLVCAECGIMLEDFTGYTLQ